MYKIKIENKYDFESLYEWYNFKNNSLTNLVALDIETNSFDSKHGEIYHFPITFYLKDKSFKTYLIDFTNKENVENQKIEMKKLIEFLQDEKKIFVFHNAKFDLGFIKNYLDLKININQVEDTFILSQHLDTSFLKNNDITNYRRPIYKFGLKALADDMELKSDSELDYLIEDININTFESFKINLNHFVKQNNIKLNKKELKNLEENNHKYFWDLFNDPEKQVEELKTFKKNTIEIAWKEFVSKKIKESLQNGLKFKKEKYNISYENAKKMHKDSLKKDEILIQLLKDFNKLIFNVNSEFYNYKIDYSELNIISPLTMFVYAIADTRLTIKLYNELWKLVNLSLKKLYVNEVNFEKQLNNFKLNYRRDINMIFPVVSMEERGLHVDYNYLDTSDKELKQFLDTNSEKMNNLIWDVLQISTEKIDRATSTEILKEFEQAFDLESDIALEDNDEIDRSIIKATENEKLTKLFNKYWNWLKLPIAAPNKIPLKIDTYKKVILMVNLLNTDEELKDFIIDKNKNIYKQEEILNLYSFDGELINYIKQTLINISIQGYLNSLKYYLDKNRIGNIYIKTFIGLFNILPEIKKLYNTYVSLKRNNTEEIKILIYKELSKNEKIETIKKNLNKIVNKIIINNRIDIIDSIFNLNVPKGYDESCTVKKMNDFIKSKSLTLIWPKRTLNKKTIPKLLSKSGEEYTEEQQEIFNKIKEFLTLKNVLAQGSSWYANYLYSRKSDALYYKGFVKFWYNISSTKTGRMSGNGQQFPKKGMYSPYNKEQEIFHPRKVYTPPKGKMYVFIDFSNIEMRVAADLTLKYNMPDVNLLRAYIPFNCKNKETNKYYDLKKDKETFMEQKWVDENNEEWKATDLHGLVVRLAFPEIALDHDIIEDLYHEKLHEFNSNKDFENYLQTNYETKFKNWKQFSSLRSLAKMISFGHIYGQGLQGMIEANPHIPKETVETIYKIKNDTYPNLNKLKETLTKTIRDHHTITNPNGKRYALKSNEGYKGMNVLAQGSAADILKTSLINVYDFLEKTNENKKTDLKIIGAIHDEIVFECSKTQKNLDLIPKIQYIMENHPNIDVKIVAEPEVSETSWAEKIDLEKLIL